MKTTTLSRSIAALAALAAVSCTENREQPLNVILVMCDDLGWGDVGFNGNEIIKTPNIDRMATSGVTFNRFYSACAVSSPTRASVLTGRSPFRMGVFNANDGILRPEEITIPELLKEQGYATGHFGKWHLGSLTADEKDANRGKVGNTKELNPPSLHGYDEAFVTESKVPTWDPMIRPAGKINNTGWDYIKEGDERVQYGTAYWDIEGRKVTDNLEGDDSRVVMDRALPFIQKSVEEGKPFLSVVWFHTPHKPCVAGPEYAAMYSEYNDDFKNYAGCVTAMDDQMGRLYDYLSKSNLLENTIIWFCSDNGPENCTTDGGGVTGGFRERKRSLYEGGVRVPAFVCGTGVKGGIKTDFPAVTSDYLPTIVALTGVDKGRCTNELDGIDLSQLIRGEKIEERTSPIVSAYMGQVSYSDSKIKVYSKGQKMEYYDIVNDPYETTPLPITAEIEAKIKAMDETILRYKASFEGEEYGVESFDRLEQTWKKDSKFGERY
ncbi:MAG: sulfatase-like hydrolase/transferase [Rikenellaceae bacterium]